MPSMNGRYYTKKLAKHFCLSALFLDLKFCKKLGVSLGEQCE
jgi:hypothetical protein